MLVWAAARPRSISRASLGDIAGMEISPHVTQKMEFLEPGCHRGGRQPRLVIERDSKAGKQAVKKAALRRTKLLGNARAAPVFIPQMHEVTVAQHARRGHHGGSGSNIAGASEFRLDRRSISGAEHDQAHNRERASLPGTVRANRASRRCAARGLRQECTRFLDRTGQHRRIRRKLHDRGVHKLVGSPTRDRLCRYGRPRRQIMSRSAYQPPKRWSAA